MQTQKTSICAQQENVLHFSHSDDKTGRPTSIDLLEAKSVKSCTIEKEMESGVYQKRRSPNSRKYTATARQTSVLSNLRAVGPVEIQFEILYSSLKVWRFTLGGITCLFQS
jgi:hypothetical protein